MNLIDNPFLTYSYSCNTWVMPSWIGWGVIALIFILAFIWCWLKTRNSGGPC